MHNPDAEESPGITSSTQTVFADIRRSLVERLSPSRLCHVMGVEGLSAFLSNRWSLDGDRVLLAALLHDISKTAGRETTRDELPAEGRYSPTPEDLDCQVVWHGLAATTVARERWGVEDADVLDAIAWHTTGNEEFSDVGLTLYVADFLEPTRDFEGVSEKRTAILSQESLPGAALCVAKAKLQYVESRGRLVHSRTRHMIHWLEARNP